MNYSGENYLNLLLNEDKLHWRCNFKYLLQVIFTMSKNSDLVQYFMEELGLTEEQAKYVVEHPCLREPVPRDRITCWHYKGSFKDCFGCTHLNGFIYVKTSPDGELKIVKEMAEIL